MTKFALGQLVCSRAVNDTMSEHGDFAAFVHASLNRFRAWDWGEMDEEDKAKNDSAVLNGDDRIFASYNNEAHPEWKIWIITEYDRSATTILFPSDY